MTKPKPRPARAVDAVRDALDRFDAERAEDAKPIEVVKVAFCAYQAYHYDSRNAAGGVESSDRRGIQRGTQSSMDRLLFNVNYWLSAYEDRIVAVCGDADLAQELLSAIAAWNSHTMKLNTLSGTEVIALFERFCPPFVANRRRSDDAAAGGRGPVLDFARKVEDASDALPRETAGALAAIVDELRDEAAVYERYRASSALDAFYDLLPAWCLQDRLELVRATWWNDADVMTLVAERLHGRFRMLDFAEPLCDYFLDAMREAIDSYAKTVASDESPYRDTPLHELVDMVRAARANHPDSEIEGYGHSLPAWLCSFEQLVWNTAVCAVCGPVHARPLLADNLSSLPMEGQAAGSDVITELARRAYALYVDTRLESGVTPEFETFESQTDDLRNSGLERIGSIPHMLEVLGYRIVPLASCRPDQRIDALKPSEVECLAILEHRRWIEERTAAGWSFSENKDIATKRSPYLVDWDDLPDRAREWNRSTARDIPTLLASAGLAISR